MLPGDRGPSVYKRLAQSRTWQHSRSGSNPGPVDCEPSTPLTQGQAGTTITTISWYHEVNLDYVINLFPHSATNITTHAPTEMIEWQTKNTNGIGTPTTQPKNCTIRRSVGDVSFSWAAICWRGRRVSVSTHSRWRPRRRRPCLFAAAVPRSTSPSDSCFSSAFTNKPYNTWSADVCKRWHMIENNGVSN